MRRFLLLTVLLLMVSSPCVQHAAVGQSNDPLPSEENDLRMVEMLPANGSEDIRVDSIITVIFNRPVAPLSTSLDVGLLPHPLRIEPEIEGQGEWLNTSIYVFHPQEYLSPAREYTIQIAEGLQAVDGSRLETAFVSTFRTSCRSDGAFSR